MTAAVSCKHVDIIRDADFIQSNLSPNLLSTFTSHSATYYRIIQTIFSARAAVVRTLDPLFTRLLHSPDIQSILLLLLLLYVSFRVLDMLYRSVLFWVRLGLNILFWGSIAAVGLWVYSRGVDGMSSDLSWVVDEWKKEYAGWKRRSEMAKVERQVRMGRGW